VNFYIKYFLLPFILYLVVSSNQSLNACCPNLGKIDLYEYIAADLVAKIEVVSFEADNEAKQYISTSKILKNYKPTLLHKEDITVVSDINYLGVALVPGKYIVWLFYDHREDVYRVSQCNRLLPLKYSQKEPLNLNDPHYVKYQNDFLKMTTYLDRISLIDGMIEEKVDGKEISGILKNGIPVGDWEVNIPNLIVYNFSFKNGLKNGTQTWYKPTHPTAINISNYNNGNLDGISKEVYPNGSPKSIITYKDNEPNGKKIIYSSNKRVGNMVNGVKEGIWRHYRLSGKIRKEIIYTLNPDQAPDPKLRDDNYLRREQREFNNQGKLIKKTVYRFQEKILEEEY